jgi:hypothetical protein
VASPDSKHWGANEFTKKRAGLKGVIKVYPMWEIEELLKARPYLGSAMTEDQVKDRYRHVGGVPRHVFDDDEASYNDVIDQQFLAANKLNGEQAKFACNLHRPLRVLPQSYSSLSSRDPSRPDDAPAAAAAAAPGSGRVQRGQLGVVVNDSPLPPLVDPPRAADTRRTATIGSRLTEGRLAGARPSELRIEGGGLKRNAAARRRHHLRGGVADLR